MKGFLVLLLLALLPNYSNAALIGIVDSGTDMKHRDIAPHAWLNDIDSTVNEKDEDNDR